MASKKPTLVEDIDFENFKVTPDRADSIREQIRRLKEIGWMEDLRILAAELGQEERPTDDSGQIELMGDSKYLVYRGAANTLLQGLAVILQGSDLLLKKGPLTLMEVLLLPKEGESAVLQVDPQLWDEVEILREALKEDLKLARQKKSERQGRLRKALGSAPAASVD